MGSRLGRCRDGALSKPDAASRASALSAAGWTKAAIGYREGQTITIDWRWATNRDLAQRHFFGGSGEFELAVDTMQRERTQAVIVQPLFTLGQSGPLAELLARRRLPASSALRPFAFTKRSDAFGMLSQQGFNVGGGTISAADPHDPGCCHRQLPHLLKTRILGHDGQAVVHGKAPDVSIHGALHPGVTHMLGVRKQIPEPLGQRWRKVLIEKELHAASVN